MQQNFRKNLMAMTIAAALGGASGLASAAGFALIEQSGSGMGNAFAGAAAVAEDASTVFFNPAGMSSLQGPQFAVAAHLINLSVEFSGSATNPAALGGGPASGGNGGDAGGSVVVPNAYFVMPYGDKWRFGLGVNVPFGLVTEYDDTWVGRFQGIKTDLKTINVNPSVSYNLSDMVSIGGGIDYQMADAELTNAVVLGPGVAGNTKLSADDDGWGWNVGLLFNVSTGTRIGLAYRSKIAYELEGDVTVTNAGGAVVASGPAKAEIDFPAMTSLSVAHQLSDRLELLADATFTQWSAIDRVNVVNTATGNLWESLVFAFDDAWRMSVGANYKLNEAWTLKGGLAYDQTPVKDASTRTVRLPDNDRYWISLGAAAKVGPKGKLAFGYSHLFVKDADINQTRSQQDTTSPVPTPAAGTATTVTGTYKGSIDILSIQYSMSF